MDVIPILRCSNQLAKTRRLNDALRNPFFLDPVGVTGGVGAHSDLLTEFPYLGPPHGQPPRAGRLEPSAIGEGVLAV